jgi:ketosteroid isomerase-like protein
MAAGRHRILLGACRPAISHEPAIANVGALARRLLTDGGMDLVWKPQPKPPGEVEVVIAWHEALNDRDFDRLTELCAIDVLLSGPQGSGAGRQLLREWFERTGLNLELGAFLQRGEVVVVSQEAQWSAGSGGAGAVENVASVFRVRDGVIVAISRHGDLDEALVAGGIKRQ